MKRIWIIIFWLAVVFTIVCIAVAVINFVSGRYAYGIFSVASAVLEATSAGEMWHLINEN